MSSKLVTLNQVESVRQMANDKKIGRAAFQKALDNGSLSRFLDTLKVPETQDQNPATLKAEIDTDLDPKLPFDGAKIEKHEKGGKVTIERRGDELFVGGKSVVLHRSDRQQNGKWIRGHDLCEELTGKPVLNACVLDFLLENTSFIPDSWKKDDDGNTIYIFFWGTIYRDSHGHLYVRYLYWSGGAWNHGYRGWLGHGWHGYDPAALLAS